MSVSKLAFRIAQVSDIHCGESTFDAKLMESVVERVNRLEPDAVVVAGDLTTAGYEWEYEEASSWLSAIEAPKIVIPGNHDSRNVGYVHFRRLFGDRFSRLRIDFDPVRAQRLRASGVTIVGVDSSEPDIDEGRVGRERYPWIREQFDEPDDVKVLAIHHHLVSIPGTGRERNIIVDAGDLLAELTTLDIDVVLSGHKHVPYLWGLNGMLICNSGTATTRRVRGLTPSSWNDLEIDASTMKVYLNYADGRRELSAIRSRSTRAVLREAFLVTDDFLASNRMVVFE